MGLQMLPDAIVGGRCVALGRGARLNIREQLQETRVRDQANASQFYALRPLPQHGFRSRELSATI
jgi:hypothetical protein